jgi:hypothetical protein
VSQPLEVDEVGNALLAFDPAAEETRLDDAPLPLALVAVWHGDRFSSSSVGTDGAGSFRVA